MRIYTVSYFSYDFVRDVAKCCDFEDLAPFRQGFRTLEEALECIRDEFNESRREEREQEECLPGMTEFPDLETRDLGVLPTKTYNPVTGNTEDDPTRFVVHEHKDGWDAQDCAYVVTVITVE